VARIRTIKPEFPQSESMGRVSRDARLLFIQIWTICDDAGRTRAASRMLASLLYPYDDDAPKLIDGWLAELEHEGCIVRYQHDGSTYLEIRNWLSHQKIDKPSQSKLPAFDEGSRIVAKPREESSEDLDLDLEGIGIGPADRPEWVSIRSEFPKRVGSHRWPEALKAAQARVTSGATWEQLLAGTRRYAAHVRAIGKEGTEFVLQAKTFFGPGDHYAEAWPVPAAAAAQSPLAKVYGEVL
jgi:hypothetical protein